MNDDMNKKIKQIAELLGGQDSMPDNIKGLLSLLATPSENKEEPVNKTSDSSYKNDERKEERSSKPDMDDTLEMMTRVKKIMNSVNTRDDPRLNLITAIKPFLNNKRQQKLGNCMRLMQMTRLTRYMNDNDKGI